MLLGPGDPGFWLPIADQFEQCQCLNCGALIYPDELEDGRCPYCGSREIEEV